MKARKKKGNNGRKKKEFALAEGKITRERKRKVTGRELKGKENI
jgi:hypothetical protein